MVDEDGSKVSPQLFFSRAHAQQLDLADQETRRPGNPAIVFDPEGAASELGCKH
jgi:hypothetical protein